MHPSTATATATATVVVLVLALAVAVNAALLAACAAACLARADGATYPAALTRAAVAFAGTLTLLAVVTSTVAGLLA
jgi:hypothetical protein